jgi:hypothetical protein
MTRHNAAQEVYRASGCWCNQAAFIFTCGAFWQPARQIWTAFYVYHCDE